jgi:hypothetical protein
MTMINKKIDLHQFSRIKLTVGLNRFHIIYFLKQFYGKTIQAIYPRI